MQEEELRAVIKKLELEGDIILNKKRNKVLLPSLNNLKKATIISQFYNFSFARTEEGEDIYIHDNDMQDAMYTDLVFLDIEQLNFKGKKSGTVRKIIKKGSRTVTGIIYKRKLTKKRSVFTFSADNGIKDDIILRANKKSKYDKYVKSKVMVRLFYGDSHNLECEVIKSYGKCDNARASANAIIDDSGVPVDFSEKVLEEADKISKQEINQEEIDNRTDLREELIFTIDGEDSKDLDDAISIKLKNNNWELGVHIADVSHYIQFNSDIDKEAQERGTSIYFADRVIPMLPKAISNGICSLNANEDKLAMSVMMTINHYGKLISYDIKKSIIRSKVRGVYSEINDILDGTADDNLISKYKIVLDSIYECDKLSKKLQDISMKRGSIDIESNESKFKIDKDGRCIDIQPRSQGKAEKIIESFMIMANECIASYANGIELPFVYRIHEEPEKDKIDSLKKVVSSLGFRLVIRKGNIKSSSFNNLLKRAKERSLNNIISHQVLRTMQKARYDYKPLGHFGLALSDYCHFTSPIRRYPDLAIHRIITDLIENNKNIEEINSKYGKFVKDISKSSSNSEIKAMRLERSIDKIYMAEYAKEHIGEMYEGTVSGINSKGIFVELPNTVEGFASIYGCIVSSDMIRIKLLFPYNTNLCIGDMVKIKIVSSNINNGQIDFKLV